MVAVLLTSLFVAVLQVGIYLHQRNVAATSVQAAARYAANADIDSSAGSQRAKQLIASAVSPSAASGLECTSGEIVGSNGLTEVEVRCVGNFPSLASALGDVLPIEVVGRAVKEGVE
ncbi:hypothetical protein GCM10027298_23720 [Epidermidibacterium keratini]